MIVLVIRGRVFADPMYGGCECLSEEGFCHLAFGLEESPDSLLGIPLNTHPYDHLYVRNSYTYKPKG